MTASAAIEIAPGTGVGTAFRGASQGWSVRQGANAGWETVFRSVTTPEIVAQSANDLQPQPRRSDSATALTGTTQSAAVAANAALPLMKQKTPTAGAGAFPRDGRSQSQPSPAAASAAAGNLSRPSEPSIGPGRASASAVATKQSSGDVKKPRPAATATLTAADLTTAAVFVSSAAIPLSAPVPSAAEKSQSFSPLLADAGSTASPLARLEGDNNSTSMELGLRLSSLTNLKSTVGAMEQRLPISSSAAQAGPPAGRDSSDGVLDDENDFTPSGKPIHARSAGAEAFPGMTPSAWGSASATASHADIRAAADADSKPGVGKFGEPATSPEAGAQAAGASPAVLEDSSSPASGSAPGLRDAAARGKPRAPGEGSVSGVTAATGSANPFGSVGSPSVSSIAREPGAAPAPAPSKADPAAAPATLPGDSFAALDREISGAAPVWVHSGAARAEAGFEDPALGWVAVRAQLDGGGVHASLVPGSTDAALALGGHLAGLNAYLAEHHAGVSAVTLSAAESRSFHADAGQNGAGATQRDFGQEAGQGSRGGNGPDAGAGMAMPLAIASRPEHVGRAAMGEGSPALWMEAGAGSYISVLA